MLPDEDAEMLMECDHCDGDGWIVQDGVRYPCPDCGGSGRE